MNSPFFSIIVPVYNVEKYLSQCLDSLLAQDFENYEIILVDDGSPDSCPHICDEYARKSKRIKVIHKQNGGLSDARNAGVAIANGDYITFADSDDFWRKNNVLSGVYDIIIQNNFSDIITSDIVKYYEENNKYLEPNVIRLEGLNGKSKQEIIEYFYFSQTDMKMSACQKFVKRELLTQVFFEKGLLSEDIDWSFQIYSLAKSICIYSNPYYCYRQQREGSITNTASQRSFDSLMYIIDKWVQKIPFLDIPEAEKDIYLGYLAYQLSISMVLYNRLGHNNKKDALKKIKSFKYLFDKPRNSKTKKVSIIVDAFGVKNTCLLLYNWLKIRKFFKLG